jgi:hypothetical protein
MTSQDDDAANAARPDLASAELELAVVTRRLGIEVPADLAGGVLHGYAALREMTVLLRRAMPAERETPGA